MKDFMTELYFYDHKPVIENLESDSDSDEFHIEIKDDVVEEGENGKVVVALKVNKRKVTITYNSEDFHKEKEKTQKKTTFDSDSDEVIPDSVSKINKIVFYHDTDSGS